MAASARRRTFHSLAFPRRRCAVQSGFMTTRPRGWFCTPASAWPPAASTTSLAAVSRGIRWMPGGWCRTSRKCSRQRATGSALPRRISRFGGKVTPVPDSPSKRFGTCGNSSLRMNRPTPPSCATSWISFARHAPSRRRNLFRRGRRQRREDEESFIAGQRTNLPSCSPSRNSTT